MFMGMRQTGEFELLSRIATNDGHGENCSYFDGWKAYDSDPFHPKHNPKGVIQMGLAENQLCFDLIEDWLKRNPEASICTREGISQFRDIGNFQDYHGLSSFRRAIARFMEKARGGRVRFDPDRVVMSGGATGAQETMAFCLANPGEAFLIPTPYYPGFDRDFRWRTGVELLPFDCYSSNKFKITQSALESAYQEAVKNNVRVKGVLVANPSNPLGTTMDRETLRSLVSFVNDKNIHLVVDEIFSGTVFDSPDFVSVAEIVEDEPGRFNRDLIHVVYSLSKDLGLPGFRVGVIYSFNDAVVRCARRMSSFGLVSTQTQHLLAAMLGDEEFTSKYLAESRRRLAERRRTFEAGLREVGVRSLDSNAGLFCWMDLRHLLEAKTVEEELKLWRIIVHEVKLNISPGASFHCAESGWFRVCFANMDKDTMDTALGRIRAFMARAERHRATNEKKKKWAAAAALRLSLPRNGRRYDDILISPHLAMSPHSPLVRAAT
ncbi:hypothetical protein ZIOFF_031275 [Zingiber officinale]|uniref:1-aminocyclopropane-1-carboxylate synthase n=2 Tax=Zingiber officinale TaxID=94328 RepID=A0A8J5GGB4_ZINOF|nr:hypothetical protein ZIOFF_031275 [Zingiber officinale]